MSSLTLSNVAKWAVPILVFCAIVGGWSFYQRYNRIHASLPGASDDQGACVLWFIGSSSMARWSTLGQDMQPWHAQNRGIEAATYPEILQRFANEDEAAPQAIILYAGENDLVVGTPLRPVVQGLSDFLKQRRALYGDIPVFILSMKPSPKRVAIWNSQLRYNAAAQILAARDPNAHYIDVSAALVQAARTNDLYQPDRVHMNPKGYAIWTRILRAELDQDMPAAVKSQCKLPSGSAASRP